MSRFNDCVAIITGASSGIGAETARLFARDGAHVCLLSERPHHEINRVAEDIRSIGGKADSYKCDVSSADEVVEVFGRIAAERAAIDVLVNSAGIFLSGPLEATEFAEAQKVIAVNFFGIFNTIKAVLPQMKARRKGAIVNVASLAAHFPSPMSSIYSASKGAVVSFARALVPELTQSGVRINTVLPGPVRTAMTSMVHTPRTPEGRMYYSYTNAMTPSSRGDAFAEPTEVAELIAFLASDAAHSIQGTDIPISRGMGAAAPDLNYVLQQLHR